MSCASVLMSRHATGFLVLALLVSRYAVEARPVADPAYVSSFSQLEHAFISGMSAVAMISHKKITFDRQLHVRSRTMMSVESEHRATLSGGDVVRLFVLHNESTLSLRGVNLVQGHPTDDLNGSFGGAIFIHSGSELRLNSVQISTNRASFGGAVYAVRSRITATGCTLTSNTAAASGGAIHAVSSTVIMTDCTVTSNSAALGGAVHTEGDSSIVVRPRTGAPGTMRLLSSRTEKGKSAKTFDATTPFAAAFLGFAFVVVFFLLVVRRRRIRKTCKDCCATAGIVDDDATLESALLDALIDPSAHPAEVLSWGDVHLTVRAAVVDHEGYNNACSGASTGTEIEAVLTTQPLIAHDNNGHDAAVAPNKDTTVSLIRQLVDTSNELTFVVDQTMRIVAWSPGKYSSARLGVLITLPLRFHKQDS